MVHPLPVPRAPRGRRLGASLLMASALLLAGCATQQPVVYQKPGNGAVEQQRAAKDIEVCRGLAEASVGRNARRADSAGRSAARTGAIGFASTAVAGLVSTSKDVWQRARAGAAAGATGAAVKTLLEWNDADEVHREYVERCMEDRGHDVLGWR
jgi:outer membrane lipoprotein SlyB